MEKKELVEEHIGRIFFYEGQESIIYNYVDDDGEDVLLKRFRDVRRDGVTLEEVSKNKEKKLEILTSLNIKEFVPVKDALYKDGMLVGYTMPRINGVQFDPDTKKKNKIEYLNKVRNIMSRLNNQGIYMGDITRSNFIFTPDGNAVCLDIDNYRIIKENVMLDFDIENGEMDRFRRRCNNYLLVDNYNFNILVVCVMGNIAEGHLNLFAKNDFPLIMYTPHNRSVYEELQFIDNDYSGELFELELKRKNS